MTSNKASILIVEYTFNKNEKVLNSNPYLLEIESSLDNKFFK